MNLMGSAGGESSALFSLLGLLKDPAAAAKQLEDLREAEQKFVAAAREAEAKSAAVLAAQADLDKRAAEVDAWRASASDQEAQAKVLADALLARERAVHLAEAAHADKVQNASDDHADREADIARRLAACADLEAKTKDAAGLVERMRADYEARLSKLREITG